MSDFSNDFIEFKGFFTMVDKAVLFRISFCLRNLYISVHICFWNDCVILNEYDEFNN